MSTSTPRQRLVLFPSSDGLKLAGLLFEPPRRSDDVVIYLHGNGDSSIFYSARTSLIGSELARRGVAWFPFNNRGAYMVKRLTRMSGGKRRSIAAGMAWERIRDCVHDIDGAIRFCRSAGYRRIHLVGHSTGANKICVYDHYKPRNSVRSYLLLAGGDDSGLYRERWGDRQFQAVLQRCRRAIAAGQGKRFVPEKLSPFFISWGSLYDTINPDGDYNVFPFLEVMTGHRVSRKPLFRHYRSIRKRTLALYGSEDEYSFGDVPGCLEILKRYTPKRNRMELEIMDGANHGFNGKEIELARRIAEWVKE
ncbi:MAG TPA: alpha/beta hydrolase [Thermoanaerobaculia bacterium]|nr:alpha/beta hydrolase [Thermoanaerobaculia bacterium]